MTSVRHRLDQTLEMPEAIGTSFPAQHLLHLLFFGESSADYLPQEFSESPVKV